MLKIIKAAPEGFNDLIEDVSRLDVVLETIKNATSDSQTAMPAMGTLLAAGRKRLTELQRS